VILVVLLRRLLLRLLLPLLGFGLLLVGFLPVFLRVLLCLGLRGIRPGMSNGRPGERQSEKDKQDTSRDFFHKITLKLILAGFYTAQQQLSAASCCNCWNSLAVMFELRCSKFELLCSEPVARQNETPPGFFAENLAFYEWKGAPRGRSSITRSSWKGVEELDSTGQKWISPPLDDAAV
jgi:hypothetical protein